MLRNALKYNPPGELSVSSGVSVLRLVLLLPSSCPYYFIIIIIIIFCTSEQEDFNPEMEVVDNPLHFT